MTGSRGEPGLNELQQVLEDGIDWMRSMRASLVEERSALELRDAERLAEASSRKARYAEQLLGVDWQQAGKRLEDRAAAGNGRAIQARWQAFLAIADDCERLNRTNGAIISARRRQLADGLAILQGRNHNEDTYSPRGATAAGGGRRTLTEA